MLSNGTSDDMNSSRSASLKSGGMLGRLKYSIRRLQMSTANTHCNNNNNNIKKQSDIPNLRQGLWARLKYNSAMTKSLNWKIPLKIPGSHRDPDLVDSCWSNIPPLQKFHQNSSAAFWVILSKYKHTKAKTYNLLGGGNNTSSSSCCCNNSNNIKTKVYNFVA